MLWNAFLWKYRHLSALHISNTRECYNWVRLWWDTWEFKLGQKQAFREVFNCELFTRFDKCSPQVLTWPKLRTTQATLYRDQNTGSPWLRKTPSASSSCLETWSSILNRQNLAQAYKSTLLCLKEEAPSSTDENFRTHLNVKQILFETYMCRSRFGFSWLLSSCIPSRPHLPCPGCGSPDFVGTQNSEQRPLYPL